MEDSKESRLRAEFEAWMRSEGVIPKLWLDHRPECGYDNGRVDDYWFGYRAASASRSEILEALKEVLDEQDCSEGYCTVSTYDKARALLAKYQGE